MAMTNAEKEVLHFHLDSSINYLEFGAGESTVYASSVSTVKSITSVESSKDFVNNELKHNSAIAAALIAGRLSFHFVDIGQTGAWGRPKDIFKKHLWPNYSLSVFREKSEYDLVLVDGRFRVACTLNCILNLPENCTILIHDFWNRPEYHIVLRFLETQDKVDTLGAFKKKNTVDLQQIQSLIETYQYLPSDIPLKFKMKQKRANFYPSQNLSKNFRMS